MKTTVKWLGIKSLILIFGFAVVACKDTTSREYPITTVAITVTSPETDAIPSATADGTGNFTIVAVTWNPAHSSFHGAETYTATVILTANTGYTFSGQIAATINGNTATIGNNTGVSVTLSYQFPQTSTPTITLGGTVSIKGVTLVGNILTAETGGLTGQSGTISYHWEAEGSNVGTDSPNYTIVAADIGKTITVTVTSSGSEGSITSNATAAVVLNTGNNLINNPSVETPNGSNNTPEGWNTNSWSDGGSFTSTFTYLNEGHTGNRSVKVEVTGYNQATTEGDAKWYFEPVQLEPGKDYVFSDFYRSNVDTRLVVAVTTAGGVSSYIELPIAPANTDWTKYKASFTMPHNGVKATVYHLLSQNGWLITDDYQIDLYHYEGFNRGMVTITFDDAWEVNTETALPIMKQYGFKSTQFYMTESIIIPYYPNPFAFIKQFIDDGHEIGSHSITHPFLTTLSSAEVTNELKGSKDYLNSSLGYLGVNVKHFSSPFGDYNAFVNNEIMKHYSSHCTVWEGYNTKDFLDLSQLKRMSVNYSTTPEKVKQWVEKARDDKSWLILLCHRVTDDPAWWANEYSNMSVANFTEHMKAIYDSGIAVKTISEALEEIRNQ